MNKLIKLLLTLALFAGVAFLVFVAGNFALAGSPLIALIPVSVVLFVIVMYIRYNDKIG
jgi:hypothetical protein